MAIANARRHREERRARTYLETLIDTSPVGVVVFDARTGAPVSFNREALRIMDSLSSADQEPATLLEVMTLLRADGREVSLREFPVAEVLSAGETVRAEEIILKVPDGRSLTVLLNATPVLSDEGGLESFVVTLQDMAAVEELERLRADFLAMVSHELRVPLTSIKGSAATVLGAPNDLDPAVVRQFFRIIEDQADHLNDLGDRPAGRGSHRVRHLAGQSRARPRSSSWWTGRGTPSTAPGAATPWPLTWSRTCHW